jgi:hypothetical protein
MKGTMKKTTIAVAAMCLLGLSTGCGGKYDKPTEAPGLPPTGAYNYIKPYSGFETASHLTVTGGNLFVTFSETAEVQRYFSTGGRVEGIEFEGLVQPTVIGKGRASVAIADASDGITVKVYGPSGGAPILTIDDPDWQRISGLAIDDDDNVYVADVVRHFVRAYGPNGNPRFEVDLADSGFGIGHVRSPMGIFIDGETLLIAEADPEKVSVQRVRIDAPGEGIPFSAEVPFITSFTDTAGNETVFEKPVGVATDSEGNIIVLDQSLGKIFRFTPDGKSSAVVNSSDIPGPEFLNMAVAIGTYRGGADNVFCLETGTGIIHRWEAQ